MKKKYKEWLTGYRKWLLNDTKNYLKKKKIRKQNMQETDTRICQK